MGDLLANVAFNFDRLINLPDGCGEQNLDKIFRLVAILNYLKSIEELTPDKKAKILEELVKAYQKQLTFKYKDGSYSLFPGDSVNIWLTASIFRAFSDSQDWIYIDEKHIQEAVNWLQTVQLPSGCFRNEGRHFNNKLEADNEVVVTAFIVISMLEHKTAYNGSIVEDALTCLRKSVADDGSVYSQALLAYAFTLSGDHELRDQILKKLDEKAIKKDGFKHWDIDCGRSGEIVAASYILLAVLSDKRTPATKRLEGSVDIFHWLVTHQTPNGGFYSTQDTNMAIQALAKYAAAIKHMKGDSTVTIRAESGFEKIVHLDKSNSLLIKTVDLPHVPGEYTVGVTGNGLVYLQSHLHYNALPDPSERGHFSLNVSTEPSVCTHETHRKFDVHMDVSYSGKRKNTNMVVILIEPLSGHLPNKASVKKLKNNPAVKRTEIWAKKISIYLDKVTHTTESLVFSLEQETNVENLQPATITVYDYYDPDEHSTVEYNAPCSAAVAHCEVNVGERDDCGQPGITREECERKGCCFNSSTHASKWCFFKG
ncbi:alpha-2-macroglobulin-like, partial [Pristimantis euphronides]